MKITLIQGENQVEARQRFTKILEAIKARGWDVVPLTTNSRLSDQLSATSLFSDNILFLLEGSVDKISADDLKWLNTNYDSMDINLLLYHKGQLGKLVTNKLPKATKIESFDLPKELFKFLELIYPGNTKQVLTMFHRLVKSEAVELVFTMLARQVKDLYWVAVDESSTGYPSWRQAKLKYQAKRFGEQKLKHFIGELAELDIKTKTSQANLVESLDFLFLTNLK